MDGANANRTFIKMHFPVSPLNDKYTVKSLYGDEAIVLLQDYSHVIKKIRNSICKSSHAAKSIRTLQKGSHYIHWEHFVSAYNWDTNTNPFTIHRKLSDEHIYLSTQSKMRNHLAEEVLNDDMLHLMKKFRDSQYDGQYLNSTIELLEHTSILVAVFRDMRPIKEISDDRLKQITSVLDWFMEWESEIKSSKSIPAKLKDKHLISDQCRQDLQSLILGFRQICLIRLSSPGATLVPGRVNSDPIENFFCQQRAKHHGANSNPNYQSYLTGINSIILGQSTI